jgi:hypothetical protein
LTRLDWPSRPPTIESLESLDRARVYDHGISLSKKGESNVKKFLSIVAVLALLAGVSYAAAQGKGDAKKKASKPKYTLKQIMQDGHKKGLLQKVATGKATAAERLKLLDMYIAMYESKPKRGDANSWTKLSADALAAAAKLVVDPKSDPAPLKKAANCKPCHSKHKAKK